MKKTVLLKRKFKLLMKFSFTQLCIAMVCMGISLAKNVDAQEILNQKINLHLLNQDLEQVLEVIEKQADINFTYRPALLKSAKKITLNVTNEPLSEVLNKILTPNKIQYKIIRKQLVLSKALDYQGYQETDSAPTPLQGMDPLANISMVERQVQGNVSDEKGEKLPGVNVTIKGTTRGTITNSDGYFSIQSSDNQFVLVFSFLGYEKQEIAVTTNTTLNISLKPDLKSLDEVVVVGYSTQKKVNLTGSVVTLDSKQLENRPAPNISNLIAGQAPGVSVWQGDGSPGKDKGNILFRGIGTLGNASPLIVVDGIQISDMTQINPDDVATISFLKDAASSAIYGLNAANGIILITTKRGKAGKPSISYNFQSGNQTQGNYAKQVNSYEYALLRNEAAYNDNAAAVLPYTDAEIQKYKDQSDPEFYANTNWRKAMFSEKALWTNHNLSISGGTESTKYNVSAGYLNQQGLIPNTGYKRYTFRTNFDQKIGRKLNIGFNLALSNREVAEPATNQGVGGINWYLFVATQQKPTDPVRFSDGRWASTGYNGVAYASTEAGFSKRNYFNILGTAFAELEIISGLKLKGIATVSPEFDRWNNVAYGVNTYAFNRITQTISNVPDNNAPMASIPEKRSASLASSNYLNQNFQGLLTYEKAIKDHYFKLLLGSEYRQYHLTQLQATRTGLPDVSLTGFNAGSTIGQTTSGNENTYYKSSSVFGRLNYVYNDKYLAEANFRNDYSSRFARAYRSGLFPSFSAGWVISKESFFHVPAVSLLKIRYSWGLLGNEQIGDFQYLSTYSTGASYIFDGALGNGYRENNVANEHITWEKTKSQNIGLDLSLWSNKFTLSADYFVRNTGDILLNLPVLGVFGASAPVQNAGKVRNKGFEFIAKYRDSKGAFNYFINANFSTVKNEIMDLAGTGYPGRQVGDPITNYYGYVAEGLFKDQEQIKTHADQSGLGAPKPGDIMYKDLNGDGKITADDRQNLGSYMPRVNYGFTLGADYKGFDISMLWQGVAKVQTMIGGGVARPFAWFGNVTPLQEHFDDRWTPTNVDARFPRTSFAAEQNYVGSSWWIFNTGFLKLRNIQLGYALPKTLLDKTKLFSKARVYVSAENPLVLSRFKILDPEFATSGVADPFNTFTNGWNQDAGYGTTKRFTVGASLSF